MTMPRDKDLKRLVRARMQKTGEAYTAARAQVLRKRTTKKARGATPPAGLTPAGKPARPVARDYAELAGMKDAVIAEKTGRTWAEWVETLDRHNAGQMAHRDIAALASKEYGVAAWWTQAVTVGYERIKGLRARGQRRDGTYEANKSRTFKVPVKTLFDAWADADVRRRWLTGAGVRVRTATSPKSIRLGWGDGTIVVCWFEAKGASKSVVAVSHTKLPDKDTANRLKQFWAGRLDALAEELG
jgi:hypothetical protein